MNRAQRVSVVAGAAMTCVAAALAFAPVTTGSIACGSSVAPLGVRYDAEGHPTNRDDVRLCDVPVARQQALASVTAALGAAIGLGGLWALRNTQPTESDARASPRPEPPRAFPVSQRSAMVAAAGAVAIAVATVGVIAAHQPGDRPAAANSQPTIGTSGLREEDACKLLDVTVASAAFGVSFQPAQMAAGTPPESQPYCFAHLPGDEYRRVWTRILETDATRGDLNAYLERRLAGGAVESASGPWDAALGTCGRISCSLVILRNGLLFQLSARDGVENSGEAWVPLVDWARATASRLT